MQSKLIPNHEMLHCVLDIAQQAGRAIMPFYQADHAVERKKDNSPVTEADIAAHHVIVQKLSEYFPAIPIISEESTSHDIPEDAMQFWLVDPLDGTKSFMRGRDEFTVNIALIEDNRPIMGVIDVPAQQMSYYGIAGQGAWRKSHTAPEESIQCAPLTKDVRAVVSLSHLDPQTERFLADYTVTEKVSAASSLKFCRVAENAADIYPRFGPTMEWDTAAGQAIVEAAGGEVITPDGEPFTYRKPELRNGAFIARGKQSL